MSGTQMLIAAMIVAASPAVAQQGEPVAPPSPPEAPPCPCAWAADSTFQIAMSRFGRAQLGVILGEGTEVDGRSGVRVEDVTEGGPAARSGLSAGDILVSVDGRPLGSEPVRRIRGIMAELEPGDTVQVAFNRDGQERTIPVVTEPGSRFRLAGPEGARVRAWRVPSPEDLRSRMPRAPAVRAAGMRAFFGAGVELVALNEGLGEYFGVSEGVLVVEVPEESTLGVEAGDVITSIDGRSVRDPGHARSILASYRPDETITLEIVRDGQRLSVTGTRSHGRGAAMHR